MLKTQKRLSWLLVCILLLGAVLGCAQKPAVSGGPVGDQEAFLVDMAKGIKERLALADEEEENMSDEEFIAFRTKLVDCELNKVGRYAYAAFADERFNTLAHNYINACQMQKDAMGFYNNTDLYNALWNGGRSARAGIIVTLYEQYNLGISSDEADSYRSNSGNYGYSVSVSGDTDVFDFFSDDNDVRLGKGDLTIEDADGSINRFNQVEYYFVVSNNSEHDLYSISVHCAILDKNENVLGTTYASISATVKSGKTVNCEGTMNLDDYPSAEYIRIDTVYYDGDDDSTIIPVEIDEKVIQRFTLTIN